MKPLVAIAIIAIALLLNLTLTKYATSHSVTYSNGTYTSSLRAKPLFVTSYSVADVGCIQRAPCLVSAFSSESGFFPRERVPSTLAAIGGLLAPYCLLAAGTALLLRALAGWWRRGAAILLIILLSALWGPLLIMLLRGAIKSNVPWDRIVADRSATNIGVVAGTALLVLIRGVSLLRSGKRH
jgi:hypothetical protein